MNQFLLGRVRLLVVGVATLFIMILFSACGVSVAGTGTGTGTGAGGTGNHITGKVLSVNPSAHTVVVDVNGTQYTVGGLTDQEVAALQSTVGKTWNFPVTGSNGSYTLSTGTSPVEQDNGTPEANVTPENNGNQGTGAVEPGSISFEGVVQSVSPSSISVKMPNGDSLQMSINSSQTELKNGLPSVNQTIKVDAIANTTDGSFSATKLEPVDSGDLQKPTKLNTVDFKGVTTSAVGSSGVINFKVGNKSYSFPLNSTTQLKDFGGNAQTIGNGQSVKVTVLFNGATGSVLAVQNSNS